MVKFVSRRGPVLGIALLVLLASGTAWATPVSFMIDSDDFVTPGLVPPGLGSSYQLVLSIEQSANLWKDVAMNTVVTLGMITSGAAEDVLVGTGPFSISNGGGGKLVVNATLMPVNGGFLSGPLLAQVTVNGVNFNDTSVALSSVPEPTTLLLLGPSLAGLAMLRRRWQKPIEA